MNEVLRLEPPFYFADAVEQIVRPLIPSERSLELSTEDLNRPEVCEALNRALRLTIERA